MKRSLLKAICYAFMLLFVGYGLLTTFALADELTPYKTGTIEGFITNIGENKVEIEEYDGTVHALTLDSSAVFSIDNRPADFSDFKIGMEIYAELKGKKISYLESYSTEVLGYIPEGGKMRSGIIKTIDRDQIILQLATGKEETYFTSAATIATKNGNMVSLNVLYEGDRVKLYFDEVNSNMISRMEIEGDSVLINNIYRGELASTDSLGNTVTITGVEIFKNGDWESLSSSKTLAYSSQISAYIGGIKVSADHMKYYRGKKVYIAVKDFFGKDQIEKLVIRSQYEFVYSDQIEDINWYSEVMELGNNKNLTFNDGTIIIKSGRLVDKYAIYSGSDAFFIGDGRGSDMMADVIYVHNENINNSNIGQDYIYEGRLDEIIEGEVVLKDFTVLDENEWESFDEDKELYYDNDTYIYDLESETQITAEEFYSGDYAVEEDSDYAEDNDLEDWYAYVYTDGDRISSIMAQQNRDSLSEQRVTNGTIESIEEDSLVGWKIDLMDAKDWSSRKDKWMAKSTSVSILLYKAMIVKNGEMITPEELEIGDRLYMVRDDSEAKVIIVK